MSFLLILIPITLGKLLFLCYTSLADRVRSKRTWYVQSTLAETRRLILSWFGITSLTLALQKTKQCTHLIVSDSSQVSKKVEYAIKWKLAVLSKDWLYRIESRNGWVDESHFALFDSVSAEIRESAAEIQSIYATAPHEVPSKSLAIKQGDSNLIVNSFDNFAYPEKTRSQPNGIFTDLCFATVGFTEKEVSQPTFM